MVEKLRYAFKLQWRGKADVPITGDFAVKVVSLQEDGSTLTTFVGQGWVFVMIMVVVACLVYFGWGAARGESQFKVRYDLHVRVGGN